MASYLLLRSNKQSGPYTFEDLHALGLKPYDLIWTEGRSAAWRYPSEIEELKEIAPVIEEQPYDRFYKKPGGEKHYHETLTEVKKAEPLLVATREEKPEDKEPLLKPAIPLFEEKKTVKEAPVIVMQTKPIEPILKPIPDEDAEEPKQFVEEPVKEERPLGKRLKVFVSLPNSITSRNISAPAQQAPSTTVQPASVIANHEALEEPVLKEEYSQPLDEIKKMYVENYLSQKNKRIYRRNKLLNYSKYAAAVLFIIILGTLVYSSIRMDNKFTPSSYADEKALNPETIKPKTTKNKPAVQQPKQDIENVILENETDNYPVTSKNATRQKQKQQPVDTDDDVMTNEQQELPIEVSVSSEDKRSSRTVVKPVDISSQVSVKANQYKRKAFGGIHDLQLTVHNDSKYVVDKVMVELQYLKPSEQPLKSEIYYFNSIAPNGSMTIKIPDNPRGIKVLYRISHIVSNQYDQDIAGL